MIGRTLNGRTVTGASSRREMSDGRTRSTWIVRCDACGKTVAIRSDTFRKSPCTCSLRKPDDVVFRNAVVCNARSGARHRGLEWALSAEQAAALAFGPCHYCGTPPASKSKRLGRTGVAGGIDRIDSSRGYVADNCVSCCWICNRAKGAATSAEFAEWMDRLVAFRCKA